MIRRADLLRGLARDATTVPCKPSRSVPSPSKPSAPMARCSIPPPRWGRVDRVANLANGRPDARPNLFTAHTGVTALPHVFTAMESHPWSSQSFMPMGAETIVIGVALPGRDGQPDLATLRAFAATAQGFSYRAGVWHLPVASLSRSIPIIGFMYEDGTPQDCVWAEVTSTTLTAG